MKLVDLFCRIVWDNTVSIFRAESTISLYLTTFQQVIAQSLLRRLKLYWSPSFMVIYYLLLAKLWLWHLQYLFQELVISLTIFHWFWGKSWIGTGDWLGKFRLRFICLYEIPNDVSKWMNYSWFVFLVFVRVYVLLLRTIHVC